MIKDGYLKERDDKSMKNLGDFERVFPSGDNLKDEIYSDMIKEALSMHYNGGYNLKLSPLKKIKKLENSKFSKNRFLAALSDR